jgi:hypothetical protein
MTETIIKYRIFAQKWHKLFAWIGGVALLLFCLSAITHPVMVWTSPQAVAFYPPPLQLETEALKSLPKVLKTSDVNHATIAKIIPSADSTWLQLTLPQTKERRYIALSGHAQLSDATHAEWLARYYTGLKDTRITRTELITAFSEDYPWVNRLLPVYKIHFDTKDNLHAYIYTETNALAGLSNDWKDSLQSIFQLLHTWSWLESNYPARLVIMLILLSGALGMAITGVMMIFTYKRKKTIKNHTRRWHRRVALCIWMPIIALATSGIIHLIFYSNYEAPAGLRLGQHLDVQAFSNSDMSWTARYASVPLNAISLVQGANGAAYFRLGVASPMHGEVVTQHQRYDGTLIEASALYIDAATGAESTLTDANMARHYAGQFLKKPAESLPAPELVATFGADYDFRNKRLPVWRITPDSTNKERIFIDPASAVLVEHVTHNAFLEGVSFSWAHKWNMLTPLLGRVGRDVLVVVVLLLTIVSSVLGYIILIRQRRKNH